MSARDEARKDPEGTVGLFQDEASFYRQPSQGWLWASLGRRQPKMRYSQRTNTLRRVDAVTGRVLSWDFPKITGIVWPSVFTRSAGPTLAPRGSPWSGITGLTTGIP